MPAVAATLGKVSGPASSAWAPLRAPTFRALWIAMLISNIGTWMQTVGAQWLLVSIPGADILVALVQTATTLPGLLLALPSGVLADIFDRRHLLIAVQLFMTTVAVAMAVATALGGMTPTLILTLTFALGSGAALTVPAFGALIPELVPRPELARASALGAVSVNLARAIGPALAGLVIAWIGVAAVFAINALSIAVFAAVLIAWRPRTTTSSEDPERFLAALRAGGRYVRHSPVTRRILVRAALFMVPASALWALLPLVASRLLGAGASGYGALMASLGVGAIVGAIVLPHLHRLLPTSLAMFVASATYAGSLLLIALWHDLVAAAVALVPAGIAWVAVLSTINAQMQLFLPVWVRARGLSAYQVVIFGGQALGALLWGTVATHAGVASAFAIAGAVMLLGAATIRLLPLFDTRHFDRNPTVYWPEPHLELEPEPKTGPVLVIVTYRVEPANEAAFVEALAQVGEGRRRTGATQWQLYRQGEHPWTFVEVFQVPSWGEHIRQHYHRATGFEVEAERRAYALAVTAPEVAHLLPAGARAGHAVPAGAPSER
ncbi:MFS transporter [Dactylosporangium matsuzakiense]|uniref:MFS transporter n=1 Tax=Dactylosporangium matsuzakiense TaxID=53360 RepID=A0A9W6KE79_9ACTN|nr:MFS transporter [Dactylosporangium matsuzakiense]GLK99271.1 MFS transporter [Dactylosporangium matsuzakiense]